MWRIRSYFGLWRSKYISGLSNNSLTHNVTYNSEWKTDGKRWRNCWISSSEDFLNSDIYLYVTCASCDSNIFVVHSKPLSRARLNWTNWFVNVFKTCEEYEHWSESEFDNWQKFPFCRSKFLNIDDILALVGCWNFKLGSSNFVVNEVPVKPAGHWHWFGLMHAPSFKQGESQTGDEQSLPDQPLSQEHLTNT